jgi:hypothetical protein
MTVGTRNSLEGLALLGAFEANDLPGPKFKPVATEFHCPSRPAALLFFFLIPICSECLKIFVNMPLRHVI